MMMAPAARIVAIVALIAAAPAAGSGSSAGAGSGSPVCWRCAENSAVAPLVADGTCAASDANLVQLRNTLCQSIGGWPGFPGCNLPGNCTRGYPDCNAEGDW